MNIGLETLAGSGEADFALFGAFSAPSAIEVAVIGDEMVKLYSVTPGTGENLPRSGEFSPGGKAVGPAGPNGENSPQSPPSGGPVAMGLDFVTQYFLPGPARAARVAKRFFRDGEKRRDALLLVVGDNVVILAMNNELLTFEEVFVHPIGTENSGPGGAGESTLIDVYPTPGGALVAIATGNYIELLLLGANAASAPTCGKLQNGAQIVNSTPIELANKFSIAPTAAVRAVTFIAGYHMPVIGVLLGPAAMSGNAMGPNGVAGAPPGPTGPGGAMLVALLIDIPSLRASGVAEFSALPPDVFSARGAAVGPALGFFCAAPDFFLWAELFSAALLLQPVSRMFQLSRAQVGAVKIRRSDAMEMNINLSGYSVGLCAGPAGARVVLLPRAAGRAFVGEFIVTGDTVDIKWSILGPTGDACGYSGAHFPPAERIKKYISLRSNEFSPAAKICSSALDAAQWGSGVLVAATGCENSVALYLLCPTMCTGGPTGADVCIDGANAHSGAREYSLRPLAAERSLGLLRSVREVPRSGENSARSAEFINLVAIRNGAGVARLFRARPMRAVAALRAENSSPPLWGNGELLFSGKKINCDGKAISVRDVGALQLPGAPLRAAFGVAHYIVTLHGDGVLRVFNGATDAAPLVEVPRIVRATGVDSKKWGPCIAAADTMGRLLLFSAPTGGVVLSVPHLAAPGPLAVEFSPRSAENAPVGVFTPTGEQLLALHCVENNDSLFLLILFSGAPLRAYKLMNDKFVPMPHRIAAPFPSVLLAPPGDSPTYALRAENVRCDNGSMDYFLFPNFAPEGLEIVKLAPTCGISDGGAQWPGAPVPPGAEYDNIAALFRRRLNAFPYKLLAISFSLGRIFLHPVEIAAPPGEWPENIKWQVCCQVGPTLCLGGPTGVDFCIQGPPQGGGAGIAPTVEKRSNGIDIYEAFGGAHGTPPEYIVSDFFMAHVTDLSPLGQLNHIALSSGGPTGPTVPQWGTLHPIALAVSTMAPLVDALYETFNSRAKLQLIHTDKENVKSDKLALNKHLSLLLQFSLQAAEVGAELECPTDFVVVMDDRGGIVGHFEMGKFERIMAIAFGHVSGREALLVGTGSALGEFVESRGDLIALGPPTGPIGVRGGFYPHRGGGPPIGAQWAQWGPSTPMGPCAHGELQLIFRRSFLFPVCHVVPWAMATGPHWGGGAPTGGQWGPNGVKNPHGALGPSGAPCAHGAPSTQWGPGGPPVCILHTIGHSIFVHELRDCAFVRGAFSEVPTFVASLAAFGNFILAGDVRSGVTLFL